MQDDDGDDSDQEGAAAAAAATAMPSKQEFYKANKQVGPWGLDHKFAQADGLEVVTRACSCPVAPWCASQGRVSLSHGCC